MVKNTYQYDVALSFAGEERDYVQLVAIYLQNSRIKVFYDEFNQVKLWGKDLYTHLDEVYRKKARYCVLFISENYRQKNWTNHERKSAQARAFQENQEYILPARFDDTEIPGVLPTIGYINLKNFTSQQFAQIVIEKLKQVGRIEQSPTDFSVRGSKLKSNQKAIAHNKRKKRELTSSSQNTMTGRLKSKTISNLSSLLVNSKRSTPKTKTVTLSREGISQLAEDKPIVYKILTDGGKNNYTGVAKRGQIQVTLQEHLQNGKNYIPGTKIQIERMSSRQEAQQKANRIIKRSKPKHQKSTNSN
jgi:TIR domain